MMDRRHFMTIATGVSLACSADLRAQGQAPPRRIGFLTVFARADFEILLELLRADLERLGWTDGRNLVIERRTTEGHNERLPSVAAELVALAPELILVQTVPATRALMQATLSIPIVMMSVGNPVENGLVADYRKPGGNVTGSGYLATEYAGKPMQLLKEAAPRLCSIAIFANPSNDHAAAYVKQLRADAVGLGMRAQVVEVSSRGDLEAAFAAVRDAGTQSMLLPPEPLIYANREAIAEFAQTQGLPLAVVGVARTLPASGLMAFAPSRTEYAQIAARYVDRILKDAKPGDLAVEQPQRFELVINLKSAKALGLTIPQALLLRADEVIQ
jgi:putative ABC transport system substrate-binding protein